MDATRIAVALAVVVGIVVPGLLSTPAGAEATSSAVVSSTGYIRMDDGVRLKYTALRPSAHGRFPVALTFAPYMEGAEPRSATPQAERFLARGYAVVGVNMRGTACSDGAFNLFDAREAKDGYDVVEWTAKQPWSNGHTGMFGLSAPGMSQYGPASLHPPHLDAIAPFQVISDVYRDIAFPGGLLNAVFAGVWSQALQPQAGDRAIVVATARGDLRCTPHLPTQGSNQALVAQGVPLVLSPYDGPFFVDRSPKQFFPKISVPLLACISWQDDMVNSRSLYSLDTFNPATTWAVLTNGYHGVCNVAALSNHLLDFFDHFVKGSDNGFDKSPHVTVVHEMYGDALDPVARAASGDLRGDVGWTTTFPSWPVPVRETTLHLGGNGRMTTTRTGPSAADTYAATPPTSANEDGYFGNWNVLWKAHDLPGTSVAYTTPRLDRDAEVFGPASVNLWVASTSTDTDLQVTLSEVRADGKELYVQRGWLRASHRATDPKLTTAVRPYQTHLKQDAKRLVPGKPVQAKVELPPLDHVFRAGSSIRLTVSGPTLQGEWGFAPNYRALPGVTSILHDLTHDSTIVLGVIPSGRAGAPSPRCDTVLSQPCRANRMKVPAGRLTL